MSDYDYHHCRRRLGRLRARLPALRGPACTRAPDRERPTRHRPLHPYPRDVFQGAGEGRDALFYASEPEKGLNGRPSIVPQGHVIGGGSSVNAMVYIRGSRADYDTWAQMGCRDWSYDKVLPVFRDLEEQSAPLRRVSWRGGG